MPSADRSPQSPDIYRVLTTITPLANFINPIFANLLTSLQGKSLERTQSGGEPISIYLSLYIYIQINVYARNDIDINSVELQLRIHCIV